MTMLLTVIHTRANITFSSVDYNRMRTTGQREKEEEKCDDLN